MRSLRDFSVTAPDPTDSKGVVKGGNLTCSLREAFYRIVGMENYETFSTSSVKDKSKVSAWDSIENLHGLIHGVCGGATINGTGFGHMAQVEVAAFDPIFWLHHW